MWKALRTFVDVDNIRAMQAGFECPREALKATIDPQVREVIKATMDPQDPSFYQVFGDHVLQVLGGEMEDVEAGNSRSSLRKSSRWWCIRLLGRTWCKGVGLRSFWTRRSLVHSYPVLLGASLCYRSLDDL